MDIIFKKQVNTFDFFRHADLYIEQGPSRAWQSNFRKHRNHLNGLIKHRPLGLILEFPTQGVWGEATGPVLPTRCQGVQVLRPHCAWHTQRNRNNTGNIELMTTCEKSPALKICVTTNRRMAATLHFLKQQNRGLELMPKDMKAISLTKPWTQTAKPKILFHIYFLTRRMLVFWRKNERGFSDDLYVGIPLNILLEYEKYSMAIQWTAWIINCRG